MTSFWKFFLDKHSFTVLLIVVLVLGGLTAVTVIPKESSPEVEIPYGIVTTVLPGASAQDVEQLVTDKIEDRVIGIEHASKITSTSGAGVSTVTVEFDANANIDKSIQLLKDEVDKAKPDLPAEAEAPTVSDVNFADQPILILSIAGDLAPAELTALGKDVKDDLERVPGVSSVTLSGVADRQVSVIVRQAALHQYGLSLSDVTNAIRTSGIAAPAGAITVSGVEYAVRLDSNMDDPSRVGDVALTGPSGESLHVRDVADVVDGLADAASFSRVSVAGAPSKPALTMYVYKSRGGNIVSTGDAVKAKLQELRKTTLAGTNTAISYDAAHDVASDLTELTRTGLETVILVMIMLFLTLGWRESIAAAVSIPLSFLVAFMGIYASGNTLNFISLFSLILAIGILVDSGIVVVEAIHTRLSHAGPREAAVAAIREYAWPLVAGTFTTIAVFVPLFFLSGIIGKFIASIPFTVIFVLLASIFVALGLVPLIALALLKKSHTAFEQRQERYNNEAKAWYERFLRSILGNRRAENRFIALIIGLFVLTIVLSATGAVKVAFFPSDNGNLLYVNIEKPQGSELASTDLSAREVEEALYHNPVIASFVTEVGASNAFGGTGGSGSKYANVTVNLVDGHRETSARIVENLRDKLKDITSARVTVGEPASGPPSDAPVLITFSGDDMAALSTTVNRAANVLAAVPGTTNVITSTRDNGSEFVVHLDAEKAISQGVSPAVVADTLRTALYGTKAADIRLGADDIEVHTLLDLNPKYQDPGETTHASIDAVRALMLPGKNGPVPLATIATIEYDAAPASIRHEDGTRIATLSSDVSGGATAVAVSSEFVRRFKQEPMPSGIEMKVGGETEDVNNSFTEMAFALLAGAAFMLSILVLEFNSFRHSLYLLSIIPLSLIGVLTGLMLTGSPLSFPAMLGVIALAGVIINHAIILMDSIARIGREEPGKSLTDIVVEAASTRFRPIILTTVVTVVGMVPLSFASALWGPLAISIMFGLAFSMVLTLVLIPVLYHRWPGKAVRARYADRGL